MTASAAGRSLELYFIDGKPDGMQTAEVFNWTGHVLMTPRTQIAAALGRNEAKYTGIYLLLGENDGEPLAYIGEAESLADRIKSHDQKKEWWDKAVLVTTGANNLNKAHVRYLEHSLIKRAKRIGRVKLDNANEPTAPGLNEAAQSNMEAFLEYLFMVLPALGIDLFIDNVKSAPRQPEPGDGETVAFELVAMKQGLKASAILRDGEFIVQRGSDAMPGWPSKAKQAHTYSRLKAELERTGVIVPNGQGSIFTSDYAFKSPSAAAAIILGRAANGTIEWQVVDSHKTYKEWEAEQLQAEEA